MTFVPKTRFSGFLIIIILFLVLVMGLLSVFIRYQNEQRLVKRAFVKLKQNSLSIKQKIKSSASLRGSKQPLDQNWKNTKWLGKNFEISINAQENVTIIPNEYESDSSISSDKFFLDIIDKSLFDEYIVFDSKYLFYRSFEVLAPENQNYLKLLKANLYLPANYNLFSRKKDSLLLNNSLNTGFIAKTTINYRKYYQFVYPVQVGNSVWYVSGLISNRNYLSKKQHVEAWILILVGILLIFALFSFQFLKLLLVTKSEKIKTSDVVLICFSISGIACIVPLMIINLYSVSGIRNNTDKQLISLNNSIKSNMVKELSLMYKETEFYGRIKEKNFDSIPYVLTDTCSQKLIGNMGSLQQYPYFKALFCSYTSGKSEHIVTTWEPDTRSRIAYRQYYRKNGEWMFPYAPGEKRFRLESIYSNTTGDVMAVLSRPGKTNPDSVYCISSAMYSLINTVLPPGFEFRIIAPDGMVWFHSDQRKNLRENFLEECDHRIEIREAMHNRVPSLVPLQISLKSYQSYISPIGGLPLFLVTLSDTQDQNEFLSHINYVFLIFILIGIFCALLSAGVFYYEKVGMKVRGREVYDAEPGLIWLLPNKYKNERYMAIVGLNMIMGLIMLIPVFFIRTSVIQLLFCIFSIYSLFFLYTYFLLKSFKASVFKKSMVITFSLVIIFCDIFYYFYLPHKFTFFGLELLTILIILSAVSRTVKFRDYSVENYLETDFLKEPARRLWISKDPYMPYILFFYSWIIISSLLPTILLFKISSREERELITRKNQLDLATKIERKNLLIDSFYLAHIYPRKGPDFSCNPQYQVDRLEKLKAGLKDKGNYLLDQYEITDSAGFLAKNSLVRRPDLTYILWSRKLRERIDIDDIRSYHMLFGIGADTLWYWDGGYLNGARSDSLSLFYTARQKISNGSFEGYHLRLSSLLGLQKTDTGTFSGRLRALRTVVILFFMAFLFVLVRILVKRLFVLEEPDIESHCTGLMNIDVNRKTFLVNTIYPIPDKAWLKNSFSILEPDHPNDWQLSENNLIVFGLLPDTVEKWSQLTSAIENAIEKTTGQIVIVSCFTTHQILDQVEEGIQNTPDTINRAVLENIRQRLIILFTDFVICFHREYMKDKELNDIIQNSFESLNHKQKEEIKAFLKKEIYFALYSHDFFSKIKDILSREDNIQRLKLKLYNSMAPKYRVIWERCTQNEKYILFDLAVDSVVNVKNTSDIRTLISKGILEVSGRLDFVSRGFKQYVLELSGTDVFQSLQKSIKRADGWNKIKTPLYVVFGAVVIFFFFTQQDIISGLFAAVISIGGFFTAIWKFGIFGKPDQAGK